MKLAITGHRPENLTNPLWVEENISKIYEELHPEIVFVGMAAGIDLTAAIIAQRMKIAYIAVKPWAGHKPRLADQETCNNVLKHASDVVEVNTSQTYPGVWVYHNRNKYMVNNSDKLLAVWNGENKGGTAACVKYARHQKKNIIHLNPNLLTVEEIINPIKSQKTNPIKSLDVPLF